MAAGAGPSGGSGRCGLHRLLGLLLLAHGKQVLSVHSAGLTGHSHAHKGHSGTGSRVGGRHLHGIALTAHQMSGGAGGIHEGRVPLQLLQHLLIFLVRRHTGHAEGNDLDTTQVTPLFTEDLVQCVCQLHGMAGQLRVADAILADLGKGGLEGGQQLGFQLAVQLVSGIGLRHVAAHIGIEQGGIADAIAVLAEAANAHININTGPLIHHAEGHGIGGAILVSDQFLGVEVIDTLILGSLTAEGEAVGHVVEYVFDAFAQIAHENGRFGGLVIGVLAGHGAHIHDLALIYDEHALAIGHRDNAAIGDDVVAALGVAAAAGGALLTLDSHHVLRQCLAIKVFLPLVSQYAARTAQCRFNQSHSYVISFSLYLFPPIMENRCYSSIHRPSDRSQLTNHTMAESFT